MCSCLRNKIRDDYSVGGKARLKFKLTTIFIEYVTLEKSEGHEAEYRRNETNVKLARAVGFVFVKSTIANF